LPVFAGILGAVDAGFVAGAAGEQPGVGCVGGLDVAEIKVFRVRDARGKPVCASVNGAQDGSFGAGCPGDT